MSVNEKGNKTFVDYLNQYRSAQTALDRFVFIAKQCGAKVIQDEIDFTGVDYAEFERRLVADLVENT